MGVGTAIFVYPRGFLYEFENKEVARKGCCKIIKTKGGFGRDRGELGRCGEDCEDWPCSKQRGGGLEISVSRLMIAQNVYHVNILF
jgi:hypothetical protein